MIWVGISMLAAYVLLFRLALPRQGEVRPFLRGGEVRVSAFAVALVALLIGGVALIVAGWS
jgi:hypothetical protein